MNYDEYFTYKEIKEQPKVFSKILKNLNEIKDLAKELEETNTIILTGCGTSYYAGISIAYALNMLTSKIALAFPSSELIFYNFKAFKNSILITISRSGETTETVKAAKKAKENGWKVLAITNNEKSTLYQIADFKLLARAGAEKSIVMTKTFSSMLFNALLLAAYLAEYEGNDIAEEIIKDAEKIPKIAEKIFKYEDLLKELASKHKKSRFVILGRGVNYGVALEAALKLRETSYLSTNAFSTLEFRHGPMALVDNKLIAIGLAPKMPDYEEDLSLYEEIEKKGGHVFIITNLKEEIGVKSLLKYDEISEFLTPVINIIPIQLLAFFIAVGKGYNPDKPRHLVKVVKI